jgi:hypothetical protein
VQDAKAAKLEAGNGSFFQTGGTKHRRRPRGFTQMAAPEGGHHDGVSEDIQLIGYCARGLRGTFGSLPKLLAPPSLAHRDMRTGSGSLLGTPPISRNGGAIRFPTSPKSLLTTSMVVSATTSRVKAATIPKSAPNFLDRIALDHLGLNQR